MKPLWALNSHFELAPNLELVFWNFGGQAEMAKRGRCGLAVLVAVLKMQTSFV